MNPLTRSVEKSFDQLVRKRYNVYNSIFLNLPFKDISSFGMQIPIMTRFFKERLENGIEPVEILEAYFQAHTDLATEKEKIDFMFRVIQYVERQIVLYDSIEDSAFSYLHDSENNLTILDYIHLGESRDIEKRIIDKLSKFSVRMVFTAHPTQFYPPEVLGIMSRLKTMIDENDIQGVDLNLQQLGMTSLINDTKPTPLDEAKNIIYYLRNVYYDTISGFFTELRKELPAGASLNPDLIRLGFWPGGDRDGNPYVTAKITMDVADELRMSLMKCYYNDLKELEKKLTFREVKGEIATLRGRIYTCMFDPSIAIRYEDISGPLLKIRQKVLVKYTGIYLDEIDRLIDKVDIFGTHFATLDIRQDHSVHKRAVEEVLIHQKKINVNLNELKEEELKAILLREDYHLTQELFKDEVIRETVQNMIQLPDIQQKNGERGCNRYIISNSEDIYSVLFAWALLRWSGLQEVKFDIIPLFETMKGMEEAPAIMQELFDIPQYRAHLENRRKEQTIMLGFSDGTKDGGYLKANWSIFKTKEVLSEICDRHGIKAIFFDGRGGPPARGGGKTHRFYAAQGKKISNHEIQLTIQGQTISSRYGTREQFQFNCDQLLTAGISKEMPGTDSDISQEARALIDELAEISYQKYRSLKDHEEFLSYLENKSTLKYYSRAKIGSRPAKRGNKKKLELKDLRAISFVGSWSQLKQNVPGYFGLGTAIYELVKQGRSNDLRKLFNEVPYFKALILNSMMSLSKCNFSLTAYHGKDPDYKDFWKVLFDEYRLSLDMLLLITGYKTLMEEEPVTKFSIEIREQIVFPLLVIQQYGLQKAGKPSNYKAEYEKLIERSLYGNINASRNSA
jgi:phosphoenolpyruvate carboxylase